MSRRPRYLLEQDRPPTDEAVSAEQILGEIHENARAGRIRTAQRLTREAAARFPGNPGVAQAERILTGDKATRRPKTGRSLRDEYRWLRSPPDEYRGRWVALIGDKVIAVADTLSDLRESLPPHLERTPLAVQVAC